MNVAYRTARATLAVVALGLFPWAAQAQILRFAPTAAPHNLTPTSSSTTTRIRVEYYNNAGVLLHTAYCGTSGCGSTFSGASKVVAALEYNPNREEVLTERCAGVLSTVPQGFCVDGVLAVTLRLRLGRLVIKHVAEGGRPLLELTTTTGPRFQFLEDSQRFWGNPSAYQLVAGAYVFPAGKYTVTSPDLPGHCLPVVTNNGQTLDVPAGGDATVEIGYRGTQCSISVFVDRAVPDLTMQSDTGSLTCAVQPGDRTVCEGRIRFNQPTRLTASLPPGQEPYFAYVNNTCEQLPLDRTTCSFKPTFDGSVRMAVRTVGSALPPADPVGLTVASGGSRPADNLVAKGASDVPLLHLRATPINGAASLQALVLQASGSGRDDLDLPNVKLVADANGNGRVDAGETVLAQGRPSADNGSLRLALASPLRVAAGVDLLVVTDVAADIHTASAAAWGGAGTVLALGLVAWPASRRRLGLGVAAAAIAIVLVTGCGGGGGDDAVAAPVDTEAPPVVVPPPPVLLTYRLDLTAVEAIDAAATANTITVDALPIAGATLTVAQ